MTPDDPIVFNYIVHNTGGNYDPTTGIYTVPIDGTYEIIFRIRAENDANVGAWLVVDGQRVCEIYLKYHCKIIIFMDEMAILHSTTHNRKQECIPVGWIPPTRYRTGMVSLVEIRWTENPLDRSPLDGDHPGQWPPDRDPLDRDPQTETHPNRDPLDTDRDHPHVDRRTTVKT